MGALVLLVLSSWSYRLVSSAWLYTQRWHVKLDFRSIKCVMAMDVLRCKSPNTVRKEAAAHLLAYNLIRIAMGEAARPKGLDILRISARPVH